MEITTSYLRATFQLSHDVVTTLVFGCLLVATSGNVKATLDFQRRRSDQDLTLLKRVVGADFPTDNNVAATSCF